MEIPKLLVLLCCAGYGLASHESHTIPVENYETELHDLGEHVDIPETPVKVIKITKTVAVKVPVPYPVKVIQKVPYPVHISKPYPVPVPQIVKVPHVESSQPLHAHEALGSDDAQYHGGQQENYEVQHSQGGPSNGNSYGTYNGGSSSYSQHLAPYDEDYGSEGSLSNSYGAPSHSYYGNGGNNDAESFDSKSYDDAIKKYLQNVNSVDSHGVQNNNHH